MRLLSLQMQRRKGRSCKRSVLFSLIHIGADVQYGTFISATREAIQIKYRKEALSFCFFGNQHHIKTVLRFYVPKR
jgi:hypothetical protein